MSNDESHPREKAFGMIRESYLLVGPFDRGRFSLD